MSENNFVYWDKMKDVPQTALKKINAGRLKGKSDISPQWRLMVMTEVFGPIGIGWNYSIAERWTEEYAGETACFVRIEMIVKHNGEWSLPISGSGGSMLLAKEKNGPYLSDEAYKMATTDALSVAMKQLGVAANIYLGQADNNAYQGGESKYQNRPEKTRKATAQQIESLKALAVELESAKDARFHWLNDQLDSGLTYDQAEDILRRAGK